MIDRTIPGVFLNEEQAMKLYNAASTVMELTELTQDQLECSLPQHLFQILEREFADVISDNSSFHFYDEVDRQDRIDHLKSERVKVDRAIAELEQKRN